MDIINGIEIYNIVNSALEKYRKEAKMSLDYAQKEYDLLLKVPMN